MQKKTLDKTPATSEGARYERAALRSMLRGRLRKAIAADADVYRDVLDWVLKRQARYEKRPGGL